MTTKHYAKATEDNGGGLTLYVIDESTGQCVYAHTGYEYGAPGQLIADMQTLIQTDDTSDWDGNDEALCACWDNLELPGANNTLNIVADAVDGRLETYSGLMGAAARREFGLSQ
jgi:hypothetical protein